MRTPRRNDSIRAFVLICAGGWFIAGCAEEEYPRSAASSTDAGAAPAMAADAGPIGPRFCTQARAESLPARLVATSDHVAVGDQIVLVSQLYNLFSTACGLCHGSINSMGGFQIATADDFTLAYIKQENVLSHVTSNIACPFPLDPTNPQEPMPPCGQTNAMPYSKRGPNDEVRQFGDLLEQWVVAGGPPSFTPTSSESSSSNDAGADAGGPVSQFAMTPANGNAMTNIGNCIPSQGLVGIDVAKSSAMDAMFAAAKSDPGGSPAQVLGLPEKLSETDLFTLDSQTLAQSGVIAYAPGYPLWSDNAGKLRYVRVPHGQSIHFNTATQQFEIPPNTRFYKTFMKQIADTDGSYRYRKVETRLIVSRPDQNGADGTAIAQTALYGSYKWRDDESDADLEENLLFSGAPFPDDIFSYNTDEQLAADILKGQPADPELALQTAGATRTYAIPSSQRCVQCHEGSPSQGFILGFTPLQINRRPAGVGGTIEATGPDELTQLRRLIDYGVVTGIDSASDVLLLEQSQGGRAPRNELELDAQGYMLGNCAHCHNPRGYPTSIQPALKDLLDFLPSASGGGIFQFPLERYSPDIFRGRTGTTPIPFITPSLMDLPRVDPAEGLPAADVFFGALGKDAVTGNPTIAYAVFAPWRSLIYRNTQSAFTYEDDLALYPHMPMNTPGYDPRAKQILSDWMVSIPAVRKNPASPEYAYYDANGNPQGGGAPDPTLQPYVEVEAGDPRYADAQSAANARLNILHTGQNAAVPAVVNPYVPYSDPGDTSDIVDPQVLLDPTCHPTPDPGAYSGTFHLGALPFVEQPHWVKTDLSQPTGYAPRRADWATYLVGLATPQHAATCAVSGDGVAEAYQDQLNVIAFDQAATLDQAATSDGSFRTFATTSRPMGLWQQKSGCDFAPPIRTVGQYTGGERAHWMSYAVPGVAAPPPSNAPVYEETPGAEVFKMICINCHGKRADGNGFIAQNLALLTGGLARVADFHDGLFGPASSPGSNLDLAFGPKALPLDAGANWTGVTDDDRGARYMAWMALGGTEVIIPTKILDIVGETPVFGVPRQLSITSANMLSAAKGLCASLLGPREGQTAPFTPGQAYLDNPALNPSLIYTNGDAELWLQMCSVLNPSPVHVIRYQGSAPIDVASLQYQVTPVINNNGIDLSTGSIDPLVNHDYYVSTGALTVGNELGATVPVVGGDAGATGTWPQWPWCLDAFQLTDAEVQSLAGPPNNYPVCPSAVSTLVHNLCPTPGCTSEDDANQWAVRGAMNAGFSVYLYVKSLETLANPPPDYTQCEQLP